MLLFGRGRPMGRDALAARLGVDIETWRDVHEPYLERSGLLERTEAGRVATPKARWLYAPRRDGSRESEAILELERLIPDLWATS